MELRRRIKRLDPVLKVRKGEFDQQSILLVELREEKIALVAALKAQQDKYMSGVQRLNQERSSSERRLLEPLERGLDLVRDEWQRIFSEVRIKENQEKAQAAQVDTAFRRLRTIETLKEKYVEDFGREMGRREQRVMDEVALRGKFQRSAS